jgi:hypothetical protein
VKERVFRPTYTRDDQQHELPEFSVRIQVGGRREIFALKTPVRAEARCGTSRNAWLAAIRAIKLSEISHDDLIQWHKDRLQNLGPDKRHSSLQMTAAVYAEERSKPRTSLPFGMD